MKPQKGLALALLLCLLLNLHTLPGMALAAENNIFGQCLAAESALYKPGIPYPNILTSRVRKVTVTFHGEPATSGGFTWYTNRFSTGSNLQIVEKTAVAPDFTRAANFSGRYTISANSSLELAHKAEATGLKADTTYFFRVGDAALGLWSDVGTFRTAPAAGAFTFIDIADPQVGSQAEAILSAQTMAKALDTVADARFIAVNGDLVETGSDEQLWHWLLDQARASLLHATLLPAAGNHEKQPKSFIDHFDLDPAAHSDTATGAYYSLNYSNAHFIVLNSNENSPQYAGFTPAQIQWLKDDVKAARAAGAQWVIVNMHKGPYTTSNHATDNDISGPNGVRTLVAPIMSELGIDLVLQGHDHIYARSKPIKNGASTPAAKMTEILKGQPIEYTVQPDGTIYLLPGTAGAKVYNRNTKINPSYFNLFEVADENHAAPYGYGQVQNFVGITIDGQKLTAVTYEINQRKNGAKPYIIDRFGIVKQAPGASSADKTVKTDALPGIPKKLVS